jgi:hypothetical protein
MILPELPIGAWESTRATLHMWMQIVGKVRLELTPYVNHWWQVPFYLTARGMTTSPIPFDGGVFSIDFDFIDHRLLITTSEGANRIVPLTLRSVADFYAAFMATLAELNITITIYPVPVEIADPVPFAEDTQYGAYDAEYVHRFWRALLWTDQVFKQFRGRFIGKNSPVHFFWGAMDLATTRFSGRPAPEREWSPELAKIMREAYSHEVSSAGFWPGGSGQDAAFYAYHVPEPPGYREASVQPKAAYYSTALGEFLLPYEAVRKSKTPEADVLAFLQSTYEAGANTAQWDRAALERN